MFSGEWYINWADLGQKQPWGPVTSSCINPVTNINQTESNRYRSTNMYYLFGILNSWGKK